MKYFIYTSQHLFVSSLKPRNNIDLLKKLLAILLKNLSDFGKMLREVEVVL